MQFVGLSRKHFLKAIGVGIATALILSPMRKLLSLVLAEIIFGTGLPMPVGLLFHVAYITLWSVIFVALFRDSLSFLRALGLALALWVIALVVFFPVNGWGILGLGVSPKLILAALVPHLLFAVVLWGLCRFVFGTNLERQA